MSEHEPAEVAGANRSPTDAAGAGGSPSLGKTATRGMLWSSVSSLAARAVGFATTIIITRWIDQRDYGRANAALTVGYSLAFLASPGLQSELIRRRQRFEEAATQALLLTVTLLLPSCALGFALAGRIAAALGAPGAEGYLRLALLIPLLNLPLLTGSVILKRQLRFGAISMLELGGASCHVSLAVGLAVAGTGGLAVVLAQVARETLIYLGGILLTGLFWLRRPRLDGPLLREMLAFGLPVFLSDALEFACANWDNLFVSTLFGAEALGAYAVAYTIAYTPAYTVVQRTSSVLLATVARFAEDRERRQSAFLRSLGAIMMLLGPLTALLMVCSTRVVTVLFSSRWAVVLPDLVTSLALVGAGLPLQFLCSYYLQATNRPRASASITLIKLTLMFGAFFLIGRRSVGLTAWCVSCSFLVSGLLACTLLARLESISLLRVARQLVPGALGSCLLALAVLGVRSLQPLASNLAMLLLEGTAGTLVYLAYLLLFHRSRVLDIVHTVAGRNSPGSRPSDAPR